jgi:propionyl-CoA synthetase
MCAYNYAFHNILDVQKKDVFFAVSDIGWIVGHNFIVYGPLCRGASTVIFEGKPIGTPNAGVMWRIIEDYQVKSFFIAPTGIRGIKKEDINGDLLK